jgi:hypothetical protein
MLNFHPSLGIGDGILQPCRKTGKFLVRYFLIFTLSDRGVKMKEAE